MSNVPGTLSPANYVQLNIPTTPGAAAFNIYGRSTSGGEQFNYAVIG